MEYINRLFGWFKGSNSSNKYIQEEKPRDENFNKSNKEQRVYLQTEKKQQKLDENIAKRKLISDKEKEKAKKHEQDIIIVENAIKKINNNIKLNIDEMGLFEDFKNIELFNENDNKPLKNRDIYIEELKHEFNKALEKYMEIKENRFRMVSARLGNPNPPLPLTGQSQNTKPPNIFDKRDALIRKQLKKHGLNVDDNMEDVNQHGVGNMSMNDSGNGIIDNLLLSFYPTPLLFL
jgi:hypothetical protein